MILKKIGRSGGASWWRVCYQRGLPRLVFIMFHTVLFLGSFPFFFILRKVFNHQKRCSSTKLPGSIKKFCFERTGPLSSSRGKEKEQYDYNEKEKTPLYLMADGTFMSFLSARLSQCVFWGDSNILLQTGI